MNTWAKDELNKIAETDDLHISPFREDGKTYGTPTWIWSVAVDGAYMCARTTGKNSRWHQAAIAAESGANHGRRNHEGGLVRAGRRRDQRPHR